MTVQSPVHSVKPTTVAGQSSLLRIIIYKAINFEDLSVIHQIQRKYFTCDLTSSELQIAIDVHPEIVLYAQPSNFKDET